MAGELSIVGASKTFHAAGASWAALRRIDLTIAPGEILAVVGTSGCGKTTLLRAVAGLERVDDGRITLDGRAVRGPGPDRGLVFQEHRLLPWLTVLDNVAFGLGPAVARREARARAAEYVGLVGLGGFERAYPHQLSGGMAQRAAIARTLVARPRVLLLDEPFAALDAFTRMQLQEELLRIWERERMTVLLVTHDIDEAAFLGDRIAVMTHRPGTVVSVVEAATPRPRDRAGEDFVRLRGRVLRALFESSHRASRPALQGAPA